MVFTTPRPPIKFITLREPPSVPLLSMGSDPPPPPDCTVQVFALVHPYRFEPAVALVWKNRSPTTQVDGRMVPVFTGRVNAALVKSTFLVCESKLNSVWPSAAAASSAANKIRYIISAAPVDTRRTAGPVWLQSRELLETSGIS